MVRPQYVSRHWRRLPALGSFPKCCSNFHDFIYVGMIDTVTRASGVRLYNLPQTSISWKSDWTIFGGIDSPITLPSWLIRQRINGSETQKAKKRLNFISSVSGIARVIQEDTYLFYYHTLPPSLYLLTLWRPLESDFFQPANWSLHWWSGNFSDSIRILSNIP